MNITNLEAAQRLAELQKLKDVTFPAIIGYRIAQNAGALETALAPYRATRDKTVMKYSKDGKSVDASEDPEGYEKCLKELVDLDQITIDIDVKKIKLKDIETKELPMSAIFALDFMIDEEGG